MKTAATLEVEQFAIAAIFPSPTNPRKHIDQSQLEELAQSIRSVGIQVPLSLRQRDQGATTYEIVGGERRWRAAKLAGLTTVPAIARRMTDEECREAQLIENLQREDLGPMEEADAYAGLLTTVGSMQMLAARVGKPLDYVTRRLKLRSLIDCSRQALEERLIALDHALLLAKLAPAEQEKALRYTLDPLCTKKQATEHLLVTARACVAGDGSARGRRYWEPQSPLELKRFIEGAIDLALSRAPWDLADATLVESAGSCAACPSNTAHNTALFADLHVEEASCTDSACFQAKKNAFVQIQTAAIAAAGKAAVRFSWKASEAAPRMLKDSKEPNPDQVFRAGQWIEADKGSCEHVQQGVAVDDDIGPWTWHRGEIRHKKIGTQLLVCVASGCKVHRKEWEKTKSSKGRYDAEAERLKQEAQRKAIAAENKIRFDLAKQAIAGVKAIPPDALRIVVMRAIEHRHGVTELVPGAEKTAKTAPVNGVEFAKVIAALVLSTSGGSIGYYHKADGNRAEFLEALQLYGVDGSAAWLQEKKAAAPAKKKAAAKPEKKAAVTAAKKKAAAKPAKQAASKAAVNGSGHEKA